MFLEGILGEVQCGMLCSSMSSRAATGSGLFRSPLEAFRHRTECGSFC